MPSSAYELRPPPQRRPELLCCGKPVIGDSRPIAGDPGSEKSHGSKACARAHQMRPSLWLRTPSKWPMGPLQVELFFIGRLKSRGGGIFADASVTRHDIFSGTLQLMSVEHTPRLRVNCFLRKIRWQKYEKFSRICQHVTFPPPTNVALRCSVH